MPDDGIGTKPQYVPYFDREAMQLQSQVSDVLLVSQLLATCKKQAGAYLDGIPTLKNIPGDVVSTVTKQLLEKGWHLRLFAWLQRIRADAPELVSENLMVIADVEYWGDIPDGELPRDRRKREIFQERYEAFVRQAISDVELRGQWDQDLQLAYAYFQKNVAHDEPGARRAFQGAFRHDGRMEAVVPYARMLVAKKHVRFAKKLLLSAWKQHGDVEALKMLTVLEFETKNSNAALQHYQYLQIMREEPKAPLAALLQDFEFPRDFDALEAIGSK